jgi:Tfp pilus assembly protein PilV
MYLSRLRKLGERGDSLVEVLISIGIITTVLAGAYVMTNTSLETSRDAQERLNATKLVQSQIELVKSVATSNPNALFGATAPTTNYCITTALAVVADTNAACKVDINGNATTGQPAFQLTISRSGNTFTVQDTWTSFNGKSQEKVFMAYRVYQQ